MAGILAPVVTGLIVDRTGAFSWAFVVAAVAAVLAMLAGAWSFGRWRRCSGQRNWHQFPCRPLSAPAGAETNVEGELISGY